MKLQAEKFILLIIISLLIWLNIAPQLIKGQPFPEFKSRRASQPDRGVEPENFCFLEVAELSNKLLQDLPGYANRVIQRTQDIHQDVGIETYIIEAGKAEFKPLPLPQVEYSPDRSDSDAVQQIFFTTLERQYTQNRKLERETYHWLFLIPTTQGWRMMMLFSRFGDATKNAPPTPPQETSTGIIGQAVDLW
ncbi:MAG TPA: hypothetical protein ACFCUY_19250, partial [Xenococcaceae cyanobacterium]